MRRSLPKIPASQFFNGGGLDLSASCETYINPKSTRASATDVSKIANPKSIMALTYSQMTALGTEAPAFDLPVANPQVDDIERATRSLDDYAGTEALVVVFMCNHCPYVIHVEEALVEVARRRIVALVAGSSHIEATSAAMHGERCVRFSL